LDEEKHPQAAGEVRSSRQASEQRQTQCALCATDENVDRVAVAESGRQTLEPPNSQRNFTWGGRTIDHQFRGLFTETYLRLKCCKKRRVQQLTEAHSMQALLHAILSEIIPIEFFLHFTRT